MTIIKILQFPDPRLRTTAEKVTDFGAETQQMIDDMFETHYATDNCAALACTQLDFKKPKHITVIDFSEHKDQPLCLVNAEIIERIGTETSPEGCMSVKGGIYEKVTRTAKIRVKAQDRFGKVMEFEASDFMAKCIQHELDHLDGKVFIDHLSHLKRNRIKKKIDKINRQGFDDHPHEHVHGEHCNHD
ncbi:MAG: peptide deformylase [Gammaproteobacteria bacterium RIFCSPHIGHO2_12_FULL_40_19]|nr:MAG: peptide deformylase [Gammaproteobacteria bacterium RIFCSPHIGHO2_12_FULL_40_19]